MQVVLLFPRLEQNVCLFAPTQTALLDTTHGVLRVYVCVCVLYLAGVAGLVEFDTAAYLFRTHLRDFAVWMVAFVSTLFLGIELGLAVSIGLALLIVIFESAFPHTAMLGRVDRSTVYRNIQQYATAEMVPGVLVVRLDAPIYFANIQWMEDKLVEYEADALR